MEKLNYLGAVSRKFIWLERRLRARIKLKWSIELIIARIVISSTGLEVVVVIAG